MSWWWLIALLGSSSAEPDPDVTEYFDALPARTPHCSTSWKPATRFERGVCMYVELHTGAIVHGHDLGAQHIDGTVVSVPGSGQQMLADMQLRAVFNAISSSAAGGSLGLGLPIPAWVSFAMVINTEGRVVAPFGCPVLTFGKKSSLQDGLLVPNPYFSSPARGLDWWEDFADASFERAARRPWDLRERSVFFRGACGPGAHARFDLMRIRDATGSAAGVRLDVGFTKADGFGSIADCVNQLATQRRAPPEDAEFVLEHRVRAQVPQANYSNFQYLLHMPGSATGSYSRNLQYLWSHGAVILVWRDARNKKMEPQEWYYAKMRPDVHYLPVNAKTLISQIRRVETDPTLRAVLIRGAREFHSEYLSKAALVERWRSILSLLRDRQRTSRPKITPKHGCTCDVRLRARKSNAKLAECAKCEITRKSDEALLRFVGLTHHAPNQQCHPRCGSSSEFSPNTYTPV